jgi:hypothetical protein
MAWFSVKAHEQLYFYLFYSKVNCAPCSWENKALKILMDLNLQKGIVCDTPISSTAVTFNVKIVISKNLTYSCFKVSSLICTDLISMYCKYISRPHFPPPEFLKQNSFYYVEINQVERSLHLVKSVREITYEPVGPCVTGPWSVPSACCN